MAQSTSRTPETDASRRGQPTKKSIDLDDLDADLIDAPDESSSGDTESDKSDDGWNPDDDSDLELGGEDDDDEEVGLDTATGLDEGLDDDELDSSGEGVSWTTDSDAADDLADTDSDLTPAGEEYGWIGDDDAAPDDEAFNPEIDDDVPVSADDGGVEGLDDDSELDELDMSSLPQMDADAEESADPQIDGAFDDLTGDMLAEEPMIEVADGVSWKRLMDRSVRTTQLSLPHGASPVLDIAVVDDVLRPLLALGTSDALFVSTDAGTSFVRVADAAATAGIAITRAETGTVLWAQNAQGALIASRDAGGSFAPAALEGTPTWISSDWPRLSVLVAADAEQPARMAQSTHGGKRFAISVLPELSGLAGNRLAACRSVLLLADHEHVYCALRDQPLHEIVEGGRAPALLLDEDEEAYLYVCLPQAQRVLILRAALRASSGVSRVPLVIAAIDRAVHGDPRAMAATYSEGLVTLHIATELALLRIDASLDGEALA